MTESELQKQCESYLKSKGIYYIHTNNNAYKQKYRKGTDYTKGQPDLIIFLQNGLTIFVELKVDNNVMSKEQVTFFAEMESIGFKFYLVYDYLEFWRIIKLYKN